MAGNKQYSVEVIQALRNFPYFVLRNEIEEGYYRFSKTIWIIKKVLNL